MNDTEMYIAVAIAFILSGTLAYIFWMQRKDAKKGLSTSKTGGAGTVTPQKLQAYERLILLTDRISLPSLISRSNQPGLNVREMQNLLVQTIRQEFDHNITQQIYVTPEAWDAVRNFKEQNLLIINQVASFMPGEAPSMELNKHLLDLLVQNPKASLQNIVSEALSFEAKKIMNS